MAIDTDGITGESARNGMELADGTNDNRFRFQDVISNRLNTRRAIRELVLPAMEELRAEVSALRAEVEMLRSSTRTSDHS